MSWPKPRLSQINWLLVVLIILINGYVLLSPLLPQLDFWRRKHQAAAVAGLPYQTKLDNSSSAAKKRSGPPKDDRLVIPKIALNQHIWQGSNPWLVNKGVWAIPQTSIPPDGGNMVMAAHRFTYDGPATFYNLDKMAVGDKIVIYWQQKEFDYTVSEVKVVPPTALDIQNPTDSPQVTLFTCTPLWSAKNRLVVIAKLEGALQP